MFKNIYTTRMSGNAKVLKARFEKINSKPMKLGGLLAFVCVVFLITTIALSTIVLAQFESEQGNVLEITNNGEILELENKPFIENGEVYLPLREFFTNIGLMETENAKMEWDNGTVLISLCEKNLNEDVPFSHTSYAYKIEIGKSELVVNPAELMSGYTPEEVVSVAEIMNNAPILKNNLTYIPFSYAERMVERADNGLMSPPDRYKIAVGYSGETFSITYPVDGHYEITQAFGKRVHPVTNEEVVHNGIDFNAPEGAEVKARINGKVTDNGFDKEKGNYVVIENDIGVEILYANLSQITRRDVYEVTADDVVGKVGSTGMSTGPHLHMEVKINGEYVDPELYLARPKAVDDMVSEMKRKGWKSIKWVKGYPDKDEWKYTCIDMTEKEKNLSIYTVWATKEGDYNNEITNETYRYKVTAVVKIIRDEESPDGRIYEIGYTADSGRDLGAESGEEYEYLNEELLYANNSYLLEYMYSY